MGTTKIALMGAGLIGREHIRFLRECRSTELVGIADPAPHVADLAAELGVSHFTEFEAMLDRLRPDAAIVALPNALHVPAALACVRRGIPALVEKPIADDLSSALRLVQATQETGIPVLIGHQRRHSPDIRAARDAVHDGRLGQVVAVNGMWFVRKHDSYFDVVWRREAGGGPLLINLIHDIDCFRFICGEIDSVQAISSNKIRGFPVEDTAALIMKFSSGALGTMILSDTVPSPWMYDIASGQAAYFPHTPADCYYIGGTKSSLAIPTMQLWWHENNGDWRDPLLCQRIPADQANSYLNQLNHFVDVVRGAAAPVCDARDGLLTLAVTTAVRTAATENRSVTVAELAKISRSVTT